MFGTNLIKCGTEGATQFLFAFVPHSALFGEPVWRKWCNDKFSKQPIQMR